MPLYGDRNQRLLSEAGWHSRRYLPHFDGRALPQFITFHLADSLPRSVLERWQEELKTLKSEQQKIVLQPRIERYLDQGYVYWSRSGCANMNEPAAARTITIVPNSRIVPAIVAVEDSRFKLLSR